MWIGSVFSPWWVNMLIKWSIREPKASRQLIGNRVSPKLRVIQMLDSF